MQNLGEMAMAMLLDSALDLGLVTGWDDGGGLLVDANLKINNVLIY